jgi:Cu-processing system permease protein
MQKIIKYVIADILRNRIVLAYTAFLLLISFSVFGLEDNASKGLLSLLNIVLIIVPLVSIVFSTIYMYNAAEFIELLVSQPLRRSHLWLSLYGGLALALTLAFGIGAGLPILLYAPSATGITMLLTGIVLTLIFVALALLAAVRMRDKARGIGAAILLWLFFSLIYDSIVLFFLFRFSDYPLEKPMIAFSSLNPVDMARILILLKMDISALMGYTGAVFRDFFGSTAGAMYAAAVLLLWILLPLLLSLRRFRRKDL